MRTAKIQVRIQIDEEVPKALKDFIIENEEKVAKMIEDRAKATTQFKDKTGRLRKSIKAKKSKYDEGGWIVSAIAPHAHLVEFGHDKIVPWISPNSIGTVPPHPFLREAKESVINEAIALFGVK